MIKYYVSKSTNGVSEGWINLNDITRHPEVVDKVKVFIPRAHGGKEQILGIPRIGEKQSAASHTYVIIGYNLTLTEDQAENIRKYISTKFFRFMVSIRKKTQIATRKVYQFVPLQSWEQEISDDYLYKKYNLTVEEISYIENTISTIDLSKEE